MNYSTSNLISPCGVNGAPPLKIIFLPLCIRMVAVLLMSGSAIDQGMMLSV